MAALLSALGHRFIRISYRTCVRSYCVHMTRYSQLPRSMAGGVNVRVLSDTILYSYDNSRFCRLMVIFSVCQAGIWACMCEFASTLRDIPIKKEVKKEEEEIKKEDDTPWYRNINLGSAIIRNSSVVAYAIFGTFLSLGSFWIAVRSINKIVLLRGGEAAKFFYFAPRFGWSFEMPLEKVSTKMSRQQSQAVLPIKIRGKLLYFWLDMRGNFSDAARFDWSVGLQRSWNK